MDFLKTGVLITFSLASFWLHSETLLCKNDFVQLGDSKASVLFKCGEPMLKDSYCKSGGDPANEDCATIDNWTYNPGSGQFLTTLKFYQGEVIAIEYGDRIP